MDDYSRFIMVHLVHFVTPVWVKNAQNVGFEHFGALGMRREGGANPQCLLVIL